MATIQKTTLKRYNGTDWDPIYLASSADLIYSAAAHTVAAGEGFTISQEIPANTATETLLGQIIDNLTKLDKVTVPAIAAGGGITSIDASKITGVINRANLPTDVGGKGVEVDDEDAKGKLTSSDVNTGDIVKVTGGKVYLVTATTPAVTFMELSDTASEVAWSRITGKPTTLSGYGITDAVNASEKVTEASSGNAGKILVLNAEGKLDVDITGSVEWDNILNKPTSTPTQIDQAVTAATHTNRTVLDALGDNAGALTYNGAAVAMQSALDTTNQTVSQHTTQIAQLGLGCLTVVDDVTVDLADAAEGKLALELI